jgi:hypothetical protein
MIGGEIIGGDEIIGGEIGNLVGYEGKMGTGVIEPLIGVCCTQPQDENLTVTTALDSRPAESRATTVSINGELAQSTLLGVPRNVPVEDISKPVPEGSPKQEKETLPMPPIK